MFASTNPSKVAVVKKLVTITLGYEVVTPDSTYQQPEETGLTYVDNAILKARDAANVLQMPALADDSGMEVDMMGGRPGVHSARYASTTRERNQKILAELEPYGDELRTARQRCAFAFVLPNGELVGLGCGTTEGAIAKEVRGNGHGFGFDEIFRPCTNAGLPVELMAAQHPVLSGWHRSTAFRQIAPWIKRWMEVWPTIATSILSKSV
jgi:XTP/dITP diphosphohydrolase